ncbi:OsmC family protein [Roseivirga sp.]|uniref:OsmC family protein n=1 Tax=Roseivirga sp. TaxID=1964215 RepID=UPI003B517A5A
MKYHAYQLENKWTGNLGNGTKSYSGYERSHELYAEGKSITIPGSSDPAFRGDKSRYNPEELFLASISTCHMLWYLHLCSANQINVLSYKDMAKGKMVEHKDGSGAFESVTLSPEIIVEEERMIPLAISLHKEAHKMCFIANSCNFEISCEPHVTINGDSVRSMS